MAHIIDLAENLFISMNFTESKNFLAATLFGFLHPKSNYSLFLKWHNHSNFSFFPSLYRPWKRSICSEYSGHLGPVHQDRKCNTEGSLPFSCLLGLFVCKLYNKRVSPCTFSVLAEDRGDYAQCFCMLTIHLTAVLLGLRKSLML